MSFNLPAFHGKRYALPAVVGSVTELSIGFSKAVARIGSDLTQANAFAWQLCHQVAIDPVFLRQSEALYTAEEYILRNLRADLHVPEIAEAAKVSRRQRIRMFRDEHRLTIQVFIRNRRTQEACRLLSTTSRPVKLIAEYIGVPDLARFNKLIRKKTGAAPRVFRAMRRG